jgi:cysteine-rich repeat protein
MLGVIMNRILFLVLAVFAVSACAPVDSGDGGGTPDAGAGNTCGNGILETGEECDDGNTRNRDGCDRNCENEGGDRCGDGEVTGNEQCDDGNTIPGDGCDQRCRNENQADGNDSFDEAEAMSGSRANGVIAVPGDVDYYSLDVPAEAVGRWLYLSTNANPDDIPAKIDTVITLYNADRTQIAENDDAHPRRNTDSEIIYKIKAEGTYYVKVQEWTTWQNETAEGQADYTYELFQGILDVDNADSLTGDAEAGDDAGSATALAFVDRTVTLALGDYRDADDVDVYSFSVVDAEKNHFTAQLMPAGTAGYGSTAPGSRLWLTNSDGDTVASITHEGKTDSVSPGGLPLGDYLVWIAPAEDHTPAANDFYTFKFGLAGDNTPEAAEEANNTLAGAETLTGTDNNGAKSFFVLATMGPGDVDYYGFDLADGFAISVACSSAASGSGVEGFRAEVRNASDEVIAGIDENADGVYIRQLAGQSPGTYYLRLSSTGQSADVTGNWARCGIHTGNPRQ